MNEQSKIWTVSEINRLVREVLEHTFYPFRIRGEMSNLTVHRSGHVYFSLKDNRCQIRCVFFRAASIARELKLVDGMQVEVDGRVTLYEVRGTCQIQVNNIHPVGTGELQKKFEKLKAKLQQEGLFDVARKRAIPKFPESVGVVTSTQGAAIRDFCQVLERRFADMSIKIYPASVQGEKAAAEIAAGISFFNRTSECNVIVLTRGGGSLEDLQPFNEETVARSVAASNIPIISAVGHETDYTICDFSADLRAPTPSAAAELVVQEKSRLRERVVNSRNRLTRAIRLRVSEWRRRLERSVGSPPLRAPASQLRESQQRVDEAAMKIQYAMERKATASQKQLEQLQGQLQSLNPSRVLKRGYSILLDNTGKTVKNTQSVRMNQELQGILAKGELCLTVKNKKEKNCLD